MNQGTPLKTLGKGLAGALAIASGTSAYGTLIWSTPPPDLTASPGGSTNFASWDVNDDGTDDFEFFNRFPNTMPGNMGVIWQTGIYAPSTNGVVSYTGPYLRYALGLGYGEAIGSFSPGIADSGGQFITLGSRYSYGSGSDYYGGFANPAVGVAPGHLAFAGFRFQAADGAHYGWIRLSVNAGIIDFVDAVYESTPDQTILTAIDPPMPEPGTMALLALGAVGVIGAVAKRRRRS